MIQSKFLFLVLAGFCLTNCKGSDPTLVHAGITADNAIQILLKADTDEKKEIAVKKLESDRRAGFDWVQFWSSSQEAIQTLPDRFQVRIFELGQQACSPEAFEQFAQLALKLNNGFEYIYGNKKSCGLPISNKVLKSYLDHFLKPSLRSTEDIQTSSLNFDLNTNQFAAFIISQYSFGPTADRLNLLKSLSAEEWARLISALLQSGQAHLAAQMVQVNQTEFGANPFLNRVIVDWLKSAENFKALVEKNNLLDLLHFITQDSGLVHATKDLPPNLIEQHFETLKEAFQKSSPKMSYDDNLRTLHLLELLPTRLSAPPSFEKQLLWVEQILRSLENAIAQGQVQLDDSSKDLITLWLKHRLNSTVHMDDQMTASNPLELALYKKLELWTLDNDQFAGALDKYCLWLNQNGVQKREIEAKEWSWAMTQKPGCIEIHGAPSIEETSDIQMAFDSVVFNKGQPLTVKAKSFDGSFINLSLPAITMVIGLRMTDQSLDGPGTYYFPVTLETAGALKLKITDFEKSKLPRVVYQKTQDPKVLDWEGYKQSLAQTKEALGDSKAQPKAIDQLDAYTKRSLLMSASRTTSGLTRIFVEPDRLNRFLPNVCSTRQCWNELGLAAAEQLTDETTASQLILEKQ